MHTPPEVLAMMRRQHGVATRTDVLAAGLSDRQIGTRVRHGEWIQDAQGIYRHALIAPTWHSRLLVAALDLDALASHRSAAVLHNIEGFRPGRCELVVARGRSRSCPDVRLHETTQWDRCDPAVVSGVPATGLLRTVIDLLAVVPVERVEHAVDALIRDDRVDWPDLLDLLVRHARRGRDGCGRLRRLLDIRYGDTHIPLSRWGRMVKNLLLDAGLGSAVLEHQIFDNNGVLIAQVDLAYPDRKIAIELDSVRWHFNQTSFRKDPRRRNRLILEGWTPLHFTWDDYAERPDNLCQTVRVARTRQIAASFVPLR